MIDDNFLCEQNNTITTYILSVRFAATVKRNPQSKVLLQYH